MADIPHTKRQGSKQTAATIAKWTRHIIFPVAAYIMLLLNSDYLYEVQEHDLFIGTRQFMADMLATPGGLWALAGSYLTQFFYHPWLGALMLVAIWTATYALLISTFRLKGIQQLFAWIPICALQISVLDIGYWLYYLQMPGYWFSQSLSFLAATLLTWIATTIIRHWWKHDISWALFIATYFATGQQFPEFAKATESDPRLQIPFIIAPAAAVLLPLCRYIHIPHPATIKESIATFAALIIFCSTTHYFTFDDYNFHAELRMMRAIDNCQWDKVLAEAQKAGHPTNLMVVYKNIALLHTGRLTDMFHINNCGTQPNSGDSLSVSIAHQDGAMVYYQFGQLNYAYRWAMENAVEYGLKAKTLKMYVRCAIMNKEFDLAAKYLTLLHKTTFHRNWAHQRDPMLLHADALYNSDEYQAISPLLNDDVNNLGMDRSMPEKWLLTHFSDIIRANTPKLEELIMCTALWTEDEYAFCIHFYNYVNNHPHTAIPEVYQQAAMMLGTAESSPITLNDFPFDPSITARYNSFKNIFSTLSAQNMDMAAIGQKMRHDYGDTYWWYYYFYTDFKIY